MLPVLQREAGATPNSAPVFPIRRGRLRGEQGEVGGRHPPRLRPVHVRAGLERDAWLRGADAGGPQPLQQRALRDAGVRVGTRTTRSRAGVGGAGVRLDVGGQPHADGQRGKPHLLRDCAARSRP